MASSTEIQNFLKTKSVAKRSEKLQCYECKGFGHMKSKHLNEVEKKKKRGKKRKKKGKRF